MDDRPRKDRLIQTRVPQDLESTLKDEARKRRLSVSHLIRNVLEDTFSLVDNVVSEVDRVVTDSVEMAQTLKRDAQRLAATARGHTAHRDRRHDSAGGPRSPSAPVGGVEEGVPGAIEDAIVEATDELATDLRAPAPVGATTEPALQVAESVSASPTPPTDGEAAASPNAGPLADVYGFQELLLNRPATCANCGTVIARGARAYLGMVDKAGLPRVWVCQDCLDTLSE
ncbi:MAG: hypothetical protein RLZZ450_6602 [Pseudomonadota bacterium]|jgi:hypothetical protein